jgi:hypothetical protein
MTECKMAQVKKNKNLLKGGWYGIYPLKSWCAFRPPWGKIPFIQWEKCYASRGSLSWIGEFLVFQPLVCFFCCVLYQNTYLSYIPWTIKNMSVWKYSQVFIRYKVMVHIGLQLIPILKYLFIKLI